MRSINMVLRELGLGLDSSSNLALRPGFKSVASSRGAAGERRSKRGGWPQHVCLLETTIHFVHVGSFYFDQEL
jgi:hypothetical protein